MVLGEVSVTAAQANALTTWVNGGGNLLAMRPSSTLSTLLGIAASGTTSNAYLKVDAAAAEQASSPTPSSTTALLIVMRSRRASRCHHLFERDNGHDLPGCDTARCWNQRWSGGRVHLDLARSVVQSRQGNPAWAGRNAMGSHRSDRMICSSAGAQPTGSTSTRSKFRRLMSSSDCSPT